MPCLQVIVILIEVILMQIEVEISLIDALKNDLRKLFYEGLES